MRSDSLFDLDAEPQYGPEENPLRKLFRLAMRERPPDPPIYVSAATYKELKKLLGEE